MILGFGVSAITTDQEYTHVLGRTHKPSLGLALPANSTFIINLVR